MGPDAQPASARRAGFLFVKASLVQHVDQEPILLSVSRRRVGVLQISIIISTSSCSSGCPSCSFPLTSMAVTVRGSSVVGLVLFGFSTLSPDRSVRLKRSMEVAGWK